MIKKKKKEEKDRKEIFNESELVPLLASVLASVRKKKMVREHFVLSK